MSSLVTKNALTAVENPIPDVSTLVKKTNYDTDISEPEKKLTNCNHDKYITNPELNTLAATVFNARLPQANLITKTDFDNRVSRLDSKIAAIKLKNESIENELQGLEKRFGLILPRNIIFDGGDSFQAYLVLQPVRRYIKIITNTKYISEWKSKGLSDESIKPPTTSNNNLNPLIDYYGYKTRLKLNGNCLKQPRSQI